MLTRKDYATLGTILHLNGVRQDSTLVSQLCNWLSKDNPRFNKHRFKNYIDSAGFNEQKATNKLRRIAAKYQSSLPTESAFKGKKLEEI